MISGWGFCTDLSIEHGSCVRNLGVEFNRGQPCKASQWLSGKESACQYKQTQVWSLGWEGSLEKEIATHSSILAWKIPWTEEPGGLQSIGLQRVGHDWATAPNQREFLFTVSFSTYCLCAKTFLCVSVCLNNFFLIKKIPMKWLIFLA